MCDNSVYTSILTKWSHTRNIDGNETKKKQEKKLAAATCHTYAILVFVSHSISVRNITVVQCFIWMRREKRDKGKRNTALRSVACTQNTNVRLSKLCENVLNAQFIVIKNIANTARSRRSGAPSHLGRISTMRDHQTPHRLVRKWFRKRQQMKRMIRTLGLVPAYSTNP